MYIKINNYVLPDNFIAISAIGSDNKRYIDIIGEITGSDYSAAKLKSKEILDSLDADANTIYLDESGEGLIAKKSCSESLIPGIEMSPFTFMFKASYKCEDNMFAMESASSYFLTSPAVIYINGNADAYPKLTVNFTGASASLSISNDNTEQEFSLTESFAVGDTLIIDSELNTLKKNGVIMIDESEEAEYLRLANGRNSLTITADGAVGVLVEYKDKSL